MKSSKYVTEMAAYQKSGVITVSVILLILQKIKLQSYRLFLTYNEKTNQITNDSNLTWILNTTNETLEDKNIDKVLSQCLLINNCISAISCIYLTSWSDKHGRKPLLILPYIGSLLSDILILVLLYVPSASNISLLICEGVNGLFGGTILISLGCLCYITDSTDHRRRTFVIATFFGLWNSTPVMDLAIQYFWTTLETGLHFRVLIICSVLYRATVAICFLIYIKFCVSESVFVLGSFQGNPWINLLTPINVSDTVNCVFKRRLDNMRFYIIILTTIFIFYTISLFGNIISFPEYFKDVFQWTHKDVIIFSAIFTVCQSLALWLISYLAIHLKILDTDLGSSGCVSLGISCLLLTFSKQGYIATIGALVGIGSLLVPVSVISALSKLVERNETGSMYAGVGFLTLMTQLISAASYTTLYKICKDGSIPKVIFLLSFGLSSFCFLFFIYLKKNISPHLLGHLNGNDSLALIDKKSQTEKYFK